MNGTMLQSFHWDYPADGLLWAEIAGNASSLARTGFTALWLPPPYKAQTQADAGYGTYDLWDLGEFDQKGGIRTKYGTRAELEAAVAAIHAAGMQVYIDVVFNHKGGADATERVTGTPVNRENRNIDIGPPREIETWTRFDFPGRGERYSRLRWNASHFDSVDFDAITGQAGTIYRLRDKQFETQVSDENGNFDYLAFADIDSGNEEVRRDLRAWGEWVVDTLGVDGFRLDAVKHIRYSLFNDWLDNVRARNPQRSLFAVGEHFTGDVSTLTWFIGQTAARMSLFDFPLYFSMRAASEAGDGIDLRGVLTNTLVARAPVQAVTFVDNHDTWREHTIQDWFRPHAYALILLRAEGYPCVFYGDYYGAPGHTSQRATIDRLMEVRRDHAYGEQRDYFDAADLIGWTRQGDETHRRAVAVLLSGAAAGGSKRMAVGRPNGRFREVTGAIQDTVTADGSGEAVFRCNGRSIAVWVEDAP
ncbi:MAG: alpha-amylase [Rhodospirillales bacterium]